MEQRSIYWLDGRQTSRVIGLSDLPDLINGPGLVWYDTVAPTAADLAEFGSTVGADPHTLEDALSARERPKITHLSGYSFLTAYALRPTGHKVRTSRISAYIYPSALITIRLDAALDMDLVVERWHQDHHLVDWKANGLLQGLLDVIVDAQFDILDQLDSTADHLSRQLFSDKPNIKAVQRKTFLMRGELVTLHRVIPQTRDVVASIIRQSLAEEWPQELRSYWEDINDHVLRASEWTDSLRDLMTSVFEASLAINDSRMNEVMKKLAAWAAIVAVPTLITGWYGMNVPYPGFSETAGLISAAGLIVVAVVTLFIVFKKNDWL
ncbi:MAG: magnesium transporter CorA family protein [Propionibacteriaceae bacterium]|nr:magnesium transporter CorA family protein [Propionibacteriaceae bacterium]